MKINFFKVFAGVAIFGFILTTNINANPSLCSNITFNNNSKNGLSKNGKTEVKWERFASDDNGFSIMLPSKPEHIKQSINVPDTKLKIDYDTYVSEPSESVVYVISVWHYPHEIDMSKPEINLQDGFGGMLSALPGSQVIKMEIGKVKDFKSLEFLVKNEGIYFQGKLILVYNTLYQVFTVYRDNVDMSKDYSKFINSFELIHPEKNKPKTVNNSSKRLDM